MSLFEQLEELKEELRQLKHQFNADGIIDTNEKNQLDALSNIILDLELQQIDEQHNFLSLEDVAPEPVEQLENNATEEALVEQETLVEQESLVEQEALVEQETLVEQEKEVDKMDHRIVTAEKAAENPAPKIHDWPTEFVVPTQDNSDQILSLFLRGEGDEDAVSHNDVEQGFLNNCTFMAALGAVANANPSAIKNLIDGPDSNGNYTVTLYVNSSDNNRVGKTAKKVIVTPEVVAFKNGRFTYAGDGDGELWPMLIEKAFVILRDGQIDTSESYENIEDMGVTETMNALTKGNAITLSTNMDKSKLTGYIYFGIRHKQAITTLTTDKEWTVDQVKGLTNRGIFDNVSSFHTYYIIGFDGSKVTLRDPVGSSKHREFELSLDNYIYAFAWITFANV